MPLNSGVRRQGKFSAMNAPRANLAELRRSAAAAHAIVSGFVPRRYLRPLVEALAHSVRCADRENSAKWGLRLNQDSIMLKVGFVEVLQIGNGWFHELVRRDLVPAALRSDRRLRFSDPHYRNAPECEACDFALPSGLASYTVLLKAYEAAIAVAAQSRRHTTTLHDHSPGLIVFLATELGAELPQPAYLVQEPDPAPSRALLASDLSEPPSRTEIRVNRIIRDTVLVQRLKALHDGRCQRCSLRLDLPDGSAYSEGHHLQPLGSPHNGPDVSENVLILCPNCHALFDLAAVPMERSSLRHRQGHAVGQQFISYHNLLVRKSVPPNPRPQPRGTAKRRRAVRP
jgi:hypothetical protein